MVGIVRENGERSNFAKSDADDILTFAGGRSTQTRAKKEKSPGTTGHLAWKIRIGGHRIVQPPDDGGNRGEGSPWRNPATGNGLLDGIALSSYLQLVNWTRRLIRHAIASSPERRSSRLRHRQQFFDG